jgi:hypothetical protein
MAQSVLNYNPTRHYAGLCDLVLGSSGPARPLSHGAGKGQRVFDGQS